MMKKILIAVILAMFAFTFVACEQEGPVEETGEKLEESMEETGEEAEEATEQMEESAEEAGDTLEEKTE